MDDLVDLVDIPPLDLQPGSVRGRRIEGDHLTVAVIEFEPGAIVPEHRHHHEQIGMCISGSITITLDGTSRTFGPGGTWRILGDRPHVAVAGPGGAVAIEAFAPIRDDWGDRAVLAPRAPAWPRPADAPEPA
jgi:quercetin dioxygenase-like cupin family protein